MNIKNNLVKSALVASIVSVATAYASLPKQPTEPVYVMAPFKLDEINVKAEQATLLTANEEYAIEVQYVADVYQDGNGVGHKWTDVEVKEIKDIRVYSEDGEIQAYVDRLDVVEIKDIIEQELRERV
jgi:glucan phosphorylase